jgi:hypothetical protein
VYFASESHRLGRDRLRKQPIEQPTCVGRSRRDHREARPRESTEEAASPVLLSPKVSPWSSRRPGCSITLRDLAIWRPLDQPPPRRALVNVDPLVRVKEPPFDGGDRAGRAR